MGIRVVSWNMAKRHEPWRQLLHMKADIGLLQEAGPVPNDVAGAVDTGPVEHWDSHTWNSDWWRGRWPSLCERWPMVVKLSDRIEVEWYHQVSPISLTGEYEVAVSGIGTIAIARVTPRDGSTEPFIAASMYARWISPHPSVKTSWTGYNDASVHRIISDLSAFIGHENPQTHRIVAAGDLNITHGYGHRSHPYWEKRYRSVFERMEAIGLRFIGPQVPNGRRSDTPAAGEPPDSRNVITSCPPGKNPETAGNIQLDYVFASSGFHEGVTVRAMNSVKEWGGSDHCRLLVEIEG